MADNLDTQSAAPATPPAATKIAAALGTFSGDQAYAGVGVLATPSGAEGSWVFTLCAPATEPKQDAIIVLLTALAALAGKATTATLSNVSGAATSGTVLASNAARLGAIIVNDSAASLYLKFGATASATSFTKKLGPGEAWDLSATRYTGVIDGIWTSATGDARVTELTA